jgi:hypothetical protein
MCNYSLQFTIATILALRPPICCSAEMPEVEPVPRGQRQLFVDDHLIAVRTDLHRTLHQPLKDNGGNVPIIALDSEFGGKPATLEANGSIVHDVRLKKWVMFAVAFCQTAPGADRTRIYRFTSDDALRWIKGDNGTPDHIRMDMLDPASSTSATNTDLFSCCYDETDAENPYKGWCWFANWGDREGIYYVYSHDGRKWKRGPLVMRNKQWQLQQAGRTLIGPGDVTIFCHDAPSKRFLASVKFYSPGVVGSNNQLRSRAYAFVDSLSAPLDPKKIDHVELLPPAKETGGDHPHDEYYASTAWRYESLWLGGLKVWHGGGDYPYSAAGCAFLKLAVSHDGLHWRKVPFANDMDQAEVFLPNGKEGGNGGQNDGGYMTEFSQGPLRIGEELIYYYGASSWGKNHSSPPRVTGGGIFRARLRVDGFVSVDKGSLTTRPLKFEGNKLYLNFFGPMQIEALDKSGKVAAITIENGNSIHREVTFDGQSLRQVAPNSLVTLRFTILNEGSLYSFAID